MNKFLIPILFPLTLLVIHTISLIFDINLYKLGILPRNINGLVGILTAPLIHSDYSHLISNTFPLFLLGIGIFYFYPKVAYKVFAFVYFATGVFVWIFARELYHIGASGIVYALVSYFFFSGIFRRDSKSISLALVVVFLYGGLIWGILPGIEGISWESHLLGSLSGFLAAFFSKKKDRSIKYDWENEKSDISPRELEVSYDPDKNKFLDEL